MNEVVSAEKIKALTAPILEKGFSFEYFYQKGGDSSCVYICRYKKGRDFFDWREVSGGKEINIVVCVNGGYVFPSLKHIYPKEHRSFNVKHIFKKATVEDRRKFVAELLCKEIESGKDNFFGIKL
ncbi:MAG: hypothetical protein E7352_06440 [Clostridiales bacterium]|nr:hypothetical protein [Clostridiales bacterium]